MAECGPVVWLNGQRFPDVSGSSHEPAAIVRRSQQDTALAEIPKVVIDRSIKRVFDGYEFLPGGEVRQVEVPGGIAFVCYRPKYREVVEVSRPYLKCEGFTARLTDGGALVVELRNGTFVSYRPGRTRIRVPCPRCPDLVDREEQDRHAALQHCPAGPCHTPVSSHHIVAHLMQALGLPDVPPSRWEELRVLTETRMDLVLKKIFTAAKKQGRVLAVNKILDAPCALCGLSIKVDDITEMIPRAPTDLLKKRPGSRWAHFSCFASPSPDRANPRAALATYYPGRDEREREA